MKKKYGVMAIACFLLMTLPAVSQNGSAVFFYKPNYQYITVPHSPGINLGTAFTMEARVNYTERFSTILCKGQNDF